MRIFRHRFAGVIGLILVLVGVTACPPVTEPPVQPAATPTPFTPPEVDEDRQVRAPQPICEYTTGERRRYETEQYWVKGQVLLTGLRGDVRELAETANRDGVKLSLLQSCDYGNPLNGEIRAEQPALAKRYDQFLDELNRLTDGLAYPTQRDDPLVTELYAIDSGQAVPEVMTTIGKLRAERENGEYPYFVFADPNYLIGPAAQSNCGSPHGVGTSPHGVGTSPHGVGTSPYAGPGIITDTAQASQFMAQAAFTTIGLSKATVKEQGASVTIGVFDTSPFPDDEVSTTGTPVTIERVNLDPFVLTVAHPPLPIDLTPTITPAVRAAEHGLFVSGLAHAVAPASSLHLIRVLNDAGCGDMATLIYEVNRFVASVAGGQKIVVNLSMGVHRPPVSATPTANCQVAEGDDNVLKCQIFSLGTLIGWQSFVGRVVFIAAAGNDSGNDPAVTTHEVAQVPADFPLAVGVSASTMDGQSPTCYTNIGHVAAPGGDGHALGGTIPPPPGVTATCAPVAKVLCQDAQCPYGLMSLVTIQSADEQGFAYWSGTSFATPLVSGMAARLLSSGMPALDVIRLLKQPMSASGYACPPPGVAAPQPALGAGVAQIDGTCP
jgi:hypothetical protein